VVQLEMPLHHGLLGGMVSTNTFKLSVPLPWEDGSVPRGTNLVDAGLGLS
jgi:hypothetical protein